ncbi:DUF1835 domain-containing protein [Labrenzia sp. CE80]|uniref:DUF1835 domain-containing protein n=1 Tax=Labrenzia sp. CE80 TaxID=1788986 RepID=UPI00129B200E|nr:DUF1835 domain-containing protein [Labrenzia sp. CE80]
MTDETPYSAQFPLFSETDLSLNLDRQRRLAKALRDDVRTGDNEALTRLAANHPRAKSLETKKLKLADAQFVIAREAGLSSWPALKSHVVNMEAAGRAIEHEGPAPDSDLQTLHIRCGNDIEQALQRAGFSGDFLMVPDPVCQGPISDGPDALAARARFIADEYPGEDESKTLVDLLATEARLAAAGDYARIVLWFEHDPYDQLLLIKILNQFRKTGADKRKVELVSLDRFPGISKFIGIGQLSPAAIRHLYSGRQPVAEAAYDLAASTSAAFLTKDPCALHALSQQSLDSLPFLAGALSRYLAELPDLHTGLSFTEGLCLQILNNGPLAWRKVFSTFMRKIDPLPYHGDLMFLGTLLRLRDAEKPALESQMLDLTPEGWGKTEFNLTEVGRQLLNGQLDWKSCGARLRYHGSITCFADPDWRWDSERQRPVTKDQGTTR